MNADFCVFSKAVKPFRRRNVHGVVRRFTAQNPQDFNLHYLLTHQDLRRAMNFRLPASFALFTTLAVTALHGQFTVSGDFDYSTGKYGQTMKTEIYNTSATLAYEHEGWNARVVIPYLTVSGPGGVIPGIGRVNGRLRIIRTQTKRTDRGLGDVVVSGGYDVYNNHDNGWFVSLSGEIKLATADEDKGLGTGKRDLSPRVDVSHTLGDFVSYVSFGYRFVGKPEGADLRDHPYGTIGLNYFVSDATTVGVAFDCTGTTSKSTNVENDAYVSLNYKFNAAWRAGVHALVGLSSAAPDFGAGLSASYTF
jgi:hypothetical protein